MDKEMQRIEQIEKIMETVGITEYNVVSIVEEQSGVTINNTEEIEELLFRCSDNDYIASLTFEELNKMPFLAAKKVIFNFSMLKRLQMLEVVKTKREYLDTMISYYGMESPPVRIMPSEFRLMVSKLKHMEILLGWLYGIDLDEEKKSC